MFNGKSFNEKFLLMRKYYDFTHAINCTRKLTCMCACTCAYDHTHLREQYENDKKILSVVLGISGTIYHIIVIYVTPV